MNIPNMQHMDIGIVFDRWQSHSNFVRNYVPHSMNIPNINHMDCVRGFVIEIKIERFK
ncbi:hypothetical protein ARV3_gp01 [Acidianus rod-shaped virus 3]|uniref:Uncharacterized protein n=1 Tax=Acidianus rod-shaped virus 3 TaxID=2730617 RepID=A0A6M3VWJ2_9VIRU|nr:hypothetical protein QIT28_gp01 [Acidianus rod-shaped virus 3]QJF12314.1 hypothetical protein ARV3_gp01 [Acidianus rod-shaped virus 3]